MFESIMKFFKRTNKKEISNSSSKDTAKERLHLVLMQDRANVSADFLDLMRQEIIEVIKKYIDIDESAMDVRLTNQSNEDGTQGAPALYANIPILNIKDETRSMKKETEKAEQAKSAKKQETEENKKEEQKKNAEEEKEADKKEEEKKAEETDETEENKKIEEAKRIVEEENDIGKSEADKKAQ